MDMLLVTKFSALHSVGDWATAHLSSWSEPLSQFSSLRLAVIIWEEQIIWAAHFVQAMAYLLHIGCLQRVLHLGSFRPAATLEHLHICNDMQVLQLQRSWGMSADCGLPGQHLSKGMPKPFWNAPIAQ